MSSSAANDLINRTKRLESEVGKVSSRLTRDTALASVINTSRGLVKDGYSTGQKGIEAEKQIRRLKETTVRDVFVSNEETYRQQIQQILGAEMLDALDSSEEFGKEPYRSALMSIVTIPELINIHFPDADAKQIKVDLSMNAVAGTFQEYMRAVKAVRKQTNENITGTDTSTKKRSEGPYAGRRLDDVFWEEKIYEHYDKYSGLYETIVFQRFTYFSNPAPFWELLNNGNTSPKRGDSANLGKPHPIQQPTHFVEKTIDKAQKSLTDSFRKKVKELSKTEDEEERNTQNSLKVMSTTVESATNLMVAINEGIGRELVRATKVYEEVAITQMRKETERTGRVFSPEEKAAIHAKAEEAGLRSLLGIAVKRVDLGTYSGFRIRKGNINLAKSVEELAISDKFQEVKNTKDTLYNLYDSLLEKYNALRTQISHMRR